LKNFFPTVSSSISAALLISHGLRFDTKLTLFFSDQIFLRFEPRRLRYLRPDEQSTFGIVKRAILIASRRDLPRAKESTPGVFAGKGSFADFLKGGLKIMYYDLKGADLRSILIPRDFKLVIGYPSLLDEDLSLLSKYGAKPVRISVSYRNPASLIVLFNNYYDRTLLEKR